MIRISPSMFVIRTILFLFWMAVIGLFLMMPSMLTKFARERSISVFSWPLLLDPIYIKNFEKETGIKVYLTYFENGPALLSKIVATKGAGFDLIIPDDHSLELLIKKKLLKKIDKSKCPFLPTLDPHFNALYYDVGNQFSIPYYWGVYGIGYDKALFEKAPPASWKVLFDPSFCLNHRICMTDDPREAILITAQYLFGTTQTLSDPAAREQVKQTLIQQKKMVEVYTSARSDTLLLNKSCGIASIMSPEIVRLMKDNSTVEFVTPQEGSFVVVDALAIPRGSKKEDMVYEFINYLFRKEVIEHHQTMYGFCSAVALLEQPLNSWCIPADINKYNFFRSPLSDNQINALWIEVLAA